MSTQIFLLKIIFKMLQTEEQREIKQDLYLHDFYDECTDLYFILFYKNFTASA